MLRYFLQASLRITPPRSALLYVILCPVPKANEKPISLYADPSYVKSWPGGAGDIKMGGNYGPIIALQVKYISASLKLENVGLVKL